MPNCDPWGRFHTHVGYLYSSKFFAIKFLITYILNEKRKMDN